MINSRRKFIKTLTVGFIGGGVMSSLPSSSHARKYDNGIEIQKGYVVFNENTQKNMEALAEALLPGSKQIDMQAKVMNYVNSDRGAATMFDAGLWNIDSISRAEYKKRFYELTDRKSINILVNHIKARNPAFFRHFKHLVFKLYYSDPAILKKLAYDGPPQPRGFMDYASAPVGTSK